MKTPVKRLKDKLTGNHQIANQTTIEVKKVVVVPQPAGAYMDISESVQEDEIEAVINQGRTVVIDPGFFSVDWVSIAAGEMRYNSSGTSLKAMSVLLDDAASRIKEEFGGQLSVEKLESAIVSGKNEILCMGRWSLSRAMLKRPSRRSQTSR
jgi:plasmid segregation protein ParM